MKRISVLLIALFFISSCKKESDVHPDIVGTPGGTLNANSVPEVTGKIDGVPFSLVVNNFNIIEMDTAEYYPLISTSSYLALYLDAIADTVAKQGFLFDRTFGINSIPPSDSLFVSQFNSGAWSFLAAGNEIFNISYVDQNGDQWDTSSGTADQTGSNFNVSEKLVIHKNGRTGVLLKATFNCKLYDNSGHVKNLTNGSAIFQYQNF
ncbi:MAG: hypothetical protein U0X76_12250 [Bacteroidia bacterium]